MNASAKEIQPDPEIVDKVLSHISEMKVANELEKDKMKSLESIDSLEKLTKEFQNLANKILEENSNKFKHQNKEQLNNILDPLISKISVPILLSFLSLFIIFLPRKIISVSYAE